MIGLFELATLLQSHSLIILLVGGTTAGLTVASWVISDALNRPTRRVGHGGGHGYGGHAEHHDERYDEHHEYEGDDDFEGGPGAEGKPGSSPVNIKININFGEVQESLKRIEGHVAPTRKKRLMDLGKNLFFAIFGSVFSIVIASMLG